MEANVNTISDSTNLIEVYVPIAPPQRSKIGPQRSLGVYVGFRGRRKETAGKKITWNAQLLSQFDPHTNQCELEVQTIIHLQNIANQLPDAFTDPKKITKSHVPAENASVRIEVSEGKYANESKACLECGRPVGSKDKNHRKRKGTNNQDGPNEEADNFEGYIDINNLKSLEEI
ncbi:uncharacterized protein LOC133791773 [Humulus lupulus]|uniref:uncharacterized protein LOC133791773 n=1 Tax=Humulus lupulus TaxID=3486 RepID=UPI002B41151E|nr:uncharacterized protein LOC133791773 [Humulus lupulus]